MRVIASREDAGRYSGGDHRQPGESRCGLCGRVAWALGGFSLWCLTCLQPFIDKGEDFHPVVTVRRRPLAVPG